MHAERGGPHQQFPQRHNSGHPPGTPPRAKQTKMNRTMPHVAAGTTATNASIAGLAAIGLVYLVPSPVWRELATITVPSVAVVLVIALHLLHQYLTDCSTAEARAAAQVDPITGLPALPVAE